MGLSAFPGARSTGLLSNAPPGRRLLGSRSHTSTACCAQPTPWASRRVLILAYCSERSVRTTANPAPLHEILLMKFRLAKRGRRAQRNAISESAKHPIPQGFQRYQWAFHHARVRLRNFCNFWRSRSLTLSAQADKSERSFERSLRRSLCRRLCRTKSNPPRHRRRKATNRRRARPRHPAG